MRALGILIVVGVVCVSAWADEPAGDAALKGPSVSASPKSEPTLIERDFEGRLRTLETDPVSAALPLLGLDAVSMEACHQILNERRAILDRVVQNNLLLLVQTQQARQSGDKDEVRRLTRELIGKAGELRARGRVLDEIKGVIPTEAFTKLDGLVRGYMSAAAKERNERGGDMSADGDAGAGAGGGAKAGAMRAEFAAMIGQEIRRSYERVVGQRVAEFEKLLKDLDVTPEQESKIRKIAADTFQRSEGKKPTRAQRAKVFLAVYKELDGMQRTRLLESVGRAGGASAEKADEKD